MATVQIMYWQEVPSMIEAKDENGSHKVQLSERYQALIDFAAMKRKLDGSDDYLMQWHKEAADERDGSAEDVAKAVAAELEDAFETMKDTIAAEAEAEG